MVGMFGDSCLIRACSPVKTVCGGCNFSPFAPFFLKKRPRYQRHKEMLALLASLLPQTFPHGAQDKGGKTDNAKHAALDILNAILILRHQEGASIPLLKYCSSLGGKELSRFLQEVVSKGKALTFDKENPHYISLEAFTELAETALAQAAQFHKREPLKQGMPRGVLSAGWGQDVPPKLAHMVIERLLKSGKLVAEGETLRLSTHKVQLASGQAGIKEKLLAAHTRAAMMPPNLKDVVEDLGISLRDATPVMQLLCDEKSLVKIRDGLYYACAPLEEILAKVCQWFDGHDDLSLADLKVLLDGLSRKYLVALMEYMDKEKITVRVGDKRQFRAKGRGL